MRLTGGHARGKLLTSPAGNRIRPTSSMVRQAIFNLVPVSQGCSFLDLYAGTGSVGLEAISRGAGRAVLVENNLDAARLVNRNIEALGYQDKVLVLVEDVLAALPKLARKGAPFDIVFVDPPYFQGLIDKTLRVIIDCQSHVNMILDKEGLLLLKHSPKENFTLPSGFSLWKTRQYGESRLSILRNLNTPE